MRATAAVRALLLAFALGWPLIGGAQTPAPPLSARVTDRTATLTNEQKTALERTLQAFEARKGSQIAVLLVPTTGREPIEQYALRVAEQWKLGRANVDDGALLVVAKDDRTLRIEVGYGLEGALTDAASKRIISEIIVPRFEQGDFYGGIAAGIDRMIRVIDGEPLPQPRRKPAGTAEFEEYGAVLFVFALVVGGMLRAVLGRLPGAIAAGGAMALLAWWFAGALFIALVAGVLAFLFTLLGGGLGRYGGWHGGGGRRGGFGGGDVGGGGGSFGGGGASGRW